MRSHQKIHFINRADNANIGDWVSLPFRYYYDFFQQFMVIRHDIDNIHWLEIGPQDIVILGSSGMLYISDSFQKNIQRLYETTPHVIAWAVGVNTPYDRKPPQPIDTKRFSLIGVRDYAHPYGLEYVPCVSCLDPALHKRAKIKRRVGVIEHPTWHPLKNLPYEKIGNNVNFDILTEFIATSEIVLTSSYHATYWSILMEKRTICVPWSSKFDYFKYKPAFYSGNIEDDIANTTIHKNALQDSIERNSSFFAKVKDYVLSTIKNVDPRLQRIHEMNRLASLDFHHTRLAYNTSRHEERFKTIDTQIANVRQNVSTVQRHADSLHLRMQEQTAGMLSCIQSRLDDIMQVNNFRKITTLCFGTGSMAENVLPAFRPEWMDIKAFIDERPSMRGMTYAGSPVIDFGQITGCSFDYILIACRPADRIAERLCAIGVPVEKIVSLDVENFFWQQSSLDDAGLRTDLLAYLRRFPGLLQAIDVPALLDSSWLRGVRSQKKQAGEIQNALLPENVSMQATTNRKLLSYLATPPPLPQLPQDLCGIHIESSNICSYRCFCCSVWNTRRPKGVLSEESLRILIQRVGKFKGEVALNYCGEPLQDKGLPEKINILRQAWPEATLNFVTTLGEDVGENFLDALWENGLNRLDVSFYGYTPELYKKIHGVPRFALATKNLQHVLQSEARKRKKGHVRLRVLHVEEQAPFLDAKYPAAAAAFREKVSAHPNVSSMDTYLMSQAGAGKVHGERGTYLPCSIAWGRYARELYVTWELDVALCCATTGDEMRLGNLREQSLEEIFAGKPYQQLIQAHWEDNLDAYPFCKRCERFIGGTTLELVRIASWKIANLLQENKKSKPVFSIVGEPRLAGPLAAFYRQHVPGFIPLAALREEKKDKRMRFVFIAAQGEAQLAFYKELQEDQKLAAKPGLHIIPLLGAGFPQPQKTLASLANIYSVSKFK